MPFSQIIAPSPSPTESKRLFYTSVSLLLSRIQGCRYHLSKFHILLRVPWTARRSNQSILKEISPEHSLEGLMLRLKLQNFGHLMWITTYLKRPWCWERLKMGEEGGNRGWDGWMASLIQWTWVWVNSRSWWWTWRPGVLQSRGLQSVRHDWSSELNWILYN